MSRSRRAGQRAAFDAARAARLRATACHEMMTFTAISRCAGIDDDARSAGWRHCFRLRRCEARQRELQLAHDVLSSPFTSAHAISTILAAFIWSGSWPGYLSARSGQRLSRSSGQPLAFTSPPCRKVGDADSQVLELGWPRPRAPPSIAADSSYLPAPSGSTARMPLQHGAHRRYTNFLDDFAPAYYLRTYALITTICASLAQT